MKEILFEQFGGPEVMHLHERETPAPGPGQVLVRQDAIGVNFMDVYRRTGLYNVPLPSVPGVEGAGTVEAVGQDVRGIRAGDRVAYVDGAGSYAEAVLVPAGRAVRLPARITFQQAAAAMMQGMTAHYLVNDTYAVQKGDTVLVHAAAGGAGLLLVQAARMRGAQVIATVSTPEKAELARGAGADEVILYLEKDFPQEVKRITAGAGVKAVYDSVGATTFLKSLDCLATRGVMVLFGQSSGKVAPLDPGLLAAKSLYLTRPTLGHYVADSARLQQKAGEVLEWVARGRLKLKVGATFPLAEAAEAHRQLQARTTTGKLLLIPR